MQLLVELGADLGAADDASGMAALHRAAARGHAGVLRCLLGAGADTWQRSAAGQTPLMYASQFGHEEAVGALLRHLACSGGDELPLAASSQHQEPAAGAGAEQQEQRALGQAGRAAASAAVIAGAAAAGVGSGAAGGPPGGSCATLAAHLAMTDASGLSALHLAAQWGMEGVAQQLLAAGAGEGQC